MKVLVDTSVWSCALRRPKHAVLDVQQTQAVALLSDLIRDGRAVLIGAIRQELLSGIKVPAQFELVKQALAAFNDLTLNHEDYEIAAQCFNTCRAQGIQGANTDFLICAVALQHQFPILSLDRDFVNYRKCLPITLIAPTQD